MFVRLSIHRIIHATEPSLLRKYLEAENLDKKSLKKVNELRILVGNFEI